MGMVTGAGCQVSRFRSSGAGLAPVLCCPDDSEAAVSSAIGTNPNDFNYSLSNDFGGFGADGIILQLTSSWSLGVKSKTLT